MGVVNNVVSSNSSTPQLLLGVYKNNGMPTTGVNWYATSPYICPTYVKTLGPAAHIYLISSVLVFVLTTRCDPSCYHEAVPHPTSVFLCVN